ncbi:ATP-dependent zinc protease family protein [Jannaschia pohangensis]|uniref:ATP-dependent zinc protease family protein n=1 Tax=Jannaschia pohangensis TaxID=390807 RepID=UPI000B81EB23|nr:RimK/LysX family protein [Jannaschia pohangensis]
MPKPKELIVIGWKERVSLPDIGLSDIMAKVDTGARTSALHADRIATFERDGKLWVRFHVQHRGTPGRVMTECPVHEIRSIKNTSGVPEDRIVIRTDLVIAGHRWRIDVSLADRANMRNPMIVGRNALSSHNVAVHTRRTKLKHVTTTVPHRRRKDDP